MWKAQLRKQTISDPSLYRLMFALEKALGHPVQIFHDDYRGTIQHAKTGEVIGTVTKGYEAAVHDR